MRKTRRQVVVDSVQGALSVAVLSQVSHLTQACASRAESSGNDELIGLYLRVSPQNTFQLTFDKVEMGQGVMTGQATIFGEEADIDPGLLRLVPAAADTRFGNLQMTAGSSSTPSRYEPLRKLGAAYRLAVLHAASKAWSVPVESLETHNGSVLHQKSGKKSPYAAFNSQLSEDDFESDPPLKNPQQFKYIGKFSRSLDAADKSTGTAAYGMDLPFENLVVAAVVHCPVFGGKIKAHNEKLQEHPLVLKTFVVSAGLAIVCKRYHHILRVRQDITAEDIAWEIPQDLKFSSEQRFSQYEEKISKRKLSTEDQKGVKHVEGLFKLPYLAHAPMEPQNCVAWKKGNTMEIWAPTQSPTLVRNQAALLSGFAREDIAVHTAKYMGGGFGRQSGVSSQNCIEIALKLDTPVQLIWSREDDMRHSPLRPMAVCYMEARVGKEEEEIRYETASESILRDSVEESFVSVAPEWMPEFMAKGAQGAITGTLGLFGINPIMKEGVNQPYDLDVDTDTHEMKSAVPVFFWRSVGHSINGFVMESFVDQLAEAKKQDPVAFRLELLKKDKRAHAVLELCAQKARWGDRSQGTHKGVAYHKSFGTHVAEIAEIEIKDKSFKVTKVTAVVDCGTVVNPHIVEAQVRSAIVFGLSAALFGEITFKDGQIQQHNFHSYRMVTLGNAPQIDVHIVTSTEPPSGIGEPGLPPIAPAVANALFQATGKRIQQLPLRL